MAAAGQGRAAQGIIQCKDGNLEVGDWVLTKYFCRELLVYGKKWLGTHTKAQVLNELNALAKK